MKTFKEEFAAIKAEIPNSRVYTDLYRVKSMFSGRPLVLYGTGRLGGAILDIYRDGGITVSKFCDRKAPGTFEGIEIIAPDTLREDYPDAVVVVCSITYKDEICDTLWKFGFSQEQIICFQPESLYFLSLREFEKHLAGYEWAYNFFEDERSRQLVLDRIRLVLCDRTLVPNTDSDCYYEDSFIALGDNEIFVDGGAYTGDSAEQFLNKIGNTGGHVYSFEPDGENFNKAVSRLSANPNVTIAQKGLWSSETELIFTQQTAKNKAGSSFVFNPGGTAEHRVPVISLDRYFAGKAVNELPTFIKMDIEGAEKEALIGAAEIIKRRKPKLAICAYHKAEDIYELPRAILGIRSDYRFALRQHGHGCFDTVLYAAQGV